MEPKSTCCPFKSIISSLWSRLVVRDFCMMPLQSKAGQGYMDWIQWTVWKKNKQKQKGKTKLPRAPMVSGKKRYSRHKLACSLIWFLILSQWSCGGLVAAPDETVICNFYVNSTAGQCQIVNSAQRHQKKKKKKVRGVPFCLSQDKSHWYSMH